MNMVPVVDMFVVDTEQILNGIHLLDLPGEPSSEGNLVCLSDKSKQNYCKITARQLPMEVQCAIVISFWCCFIATFDLYASHAQTSSMQHSYSHAEKKPTQSYKVPGN